VKALLFLLPLLRPQLLVRMAHLVPGDRVQVRAPLLSAVCAVVRGVRRRPR
jgi:hypothetical protein